ncbi:MAG: acyl carrier protein [Bacteroidales bacterium]|nr:acyl carrier protein [Candidatus Liminaster caballi]
MLSNGEESNKELVLELKNNILSALNLDYLTPEQIDETSPLLGETLGLDHIDLIEIIVMLKRKYKVNITNLEYAKRELNSISDIAKFISKHQQ